MKGDKVKVFHLVREQDVTGTSGTGIVAMGAIFPSGRAIIEWVASNHPTIEIANNLDELELIHGHGNRTKVIMRNPK